MRTLVILLALGLATPAGAQSYLALSQARDAEAAADAMATRNREVALTNQLAVLEARVQADRALSDLQAARATPTLPTVARGPHAPAPVVDTRKLASIPDDTLARSNAAVRAAADNRR
jgi:hypothetical protein